MPGALDGIKVLDLTSVIMGPYCTQILGDMGADVIKVETHAGDNMRWVGPMKNPGMGHIHLHLNRNKRFIVLDLKKPQGLEACLRLAAEADVLVYNVRPQSMARLGLGYAEVKKVNPRIIYVGAFGYSEKGPYAGRPAYDDLIQGIAGIPSLSQRQTGGLPRYSPVTIGDRSVGLHTANAVLAALFHRERGGPNAEGQAIEITMFEAMSQFVLGDHMAGKTFDPPLGETAYARLIAPHRRPYATADGYLCVLIYNDKHWAAFFDAIGRPDLKSNPKFAEHTQRAANIAEVYAFVAETIEAQSTAYWRQLLEKADIPFATMHTIDSLLEDEHMQAIGFFPEFDHPTEGRIRATAPVGEWSETPTSIRSLPGRLGEHSREVLREVGYSVEEIDAMMAGRVTVEPPGTPAG
ncbi:MAG: CaiB/BaiF CoA transferase family protein [Burkholderiales bacterium]|nr:CoA transferase [Rhodocyclaceae bacterium]MCA3022059.1 CoA transferase [Rhodocyclaceae bacterium]MCA3053993.1 CoA transferase [Rhodocyclaceae bacterium]